MRHVVITDQTVAELYGKKLFPQYSLFAFPAGESSKTGQTKELLEEAMLEAGFRRDTTVIGLGGGVVTDIAGFVAATFCRGVPLILIPTTLVGMIDAAIGGKNGVNTSQGKNLIGTLYHPQKVVVDTRFLATLPAVEMQNGLVEMAKYALIADPALLETWDLYQAIECKRRIIARDVTETGLRRILNLGHTIGHALETLSHYQIPHGEAVSIGIFFECALAFRLGVLAEDDWKKIQTLFPPRPLPFAPEAVAAALQYDKKSAAGVIRFVLLEKIGQPGVYGGAYCAPVAEELLLEVLHDAALCSPIR